MGLAKNSFGTLISSSAVFLIHFPVSILTARFLGPEGKGLLYLLLLSVSTCRALGHLGLGSAAIYFIGKDRKRLPAVLGNLLAVTGVAGIIFAVAGWLFLHYGRPDMYARLPLWMWAVAALLIPTHLLRAFLTQVLSAVLRIKEINVMEVVVTAIHLPLFITLVVIMGKGVAGAFLASAFSDLFAATSFFLLVLLYGGPPARPDPTLLGASLRFGAKSYLSSQMKRLNLRLDAFFVAGLAANGMNATGIYSVATHVAELVLFIPAAIRLSLFPMVAAGSTVEANRLTSTACRHTMFLTLIIALGSLVCGPFVIHLLYGKEFADAVIPLLILLPGTVMLSQARLFYNDLTGRGKPGVSSLSAALAFVVTVALDLVLIPRYGAIGAAIASTCAYGIEFLVGGVFFLHYSGLTWRETLLFRRSDLDRYPGFLAGFFTSRS